MATTDIDFPIPKGYNPPFAVITDHDHSAYLIIACALGIALVSLSIVIHVFLRTAFGHGFGWDDTVLFLATAVAFVQSSLTWTAAVQGLGASLTLLTPTQLETVQEIFYASHVLTIVALAFTKCSVGLFILRLTPFRGHKTLVWIIMALVAIWMCSSVLAMSLQCDLSHPWAFAARRCSGSRARIIGVGVVDILTELALIAVVVWMALTLHSATSTKVVVVVAFGFRLPLILFVVLRILRWDPVSLSSDFTLSADMYVVWTQVEIYYSIISATIPSIRPLVHSLNTRYGAGFTPSQPSVHAKA